MKTNKVKKSFHLGGDLGTDICLRGWPLLIDENTRPFTPTLEERKTPVRCTVDGKIFATKNTNRKLLLEFYDDSTPPLPPVFNVDMFAGGGVEKEKIIATKFSARHKSSTLTLGSARGERSRPLIRGLGSLIVLC